MNENTGFLGRIEQWFKKPFNSQGDATSWVLFVGLIIIAAFLWNITLLMLTKEI